MRLSSSVLICLAASLLASGCASPSSSPQATAAAMSAQALPEAEHVALTVDERTVDLSIYRPVTTPQAAIFLSHGAGGSPARLIRVIEHLQQAGFVVLAPLHGDSLLIPEDRRDDIRSALLTRIADMKAVSAYADRNFASLPYGAVGHSYGSLISLIGGGALDAMLSSRVPSMEAVVMFSSPGVIPELTEPAGVIESAAVPTLLVTGTQDAVEPFALDPSAHLTYFDRQANAQSALLLVDGATHNFVFGDEPGFARTMKLMVDFLRAEISGDPASAAAFRAAQSDDGIEIRRR